MLARMQDVREPHDESRGGRKQWPDPTPRSRFGTALLFAIAFAATVAVAAIMLRRAPSRGVPAERLPIPAGEPAGETVLPPTFPLLLDSTPDGAEVYENDVRIGKTPLRLVVVNETLNAHPRRFRIERSGFRQFFVTQGPSTEPVRVLAALIPESR
jgi:hypothetical protein